MKITDEQIRNSQEWELRLAEGKCNLNDALYMCMASGAPISAYMLQQYSQAINSYCDGQFDDLADAFGIAMSKSSKKAMKKIDIQRKIMVIVNAFADKGFPKTNPSHFEQTAFHKAGDLINKSPSHTYDQYLEAIKDSKIS